MDQGRLFQQLGQYDTAVQSFAEALVANDCTANDRHEAFVRSADCCSQTGHTVQVGSPLLSTVTSVRQQPFELRY